MVRSSAPSPPRSAPPSRPARSGHGGGSPRTAPGPDGCGSPRPPTRSAVPSLDQQPSVRGRPQLRHRVHLPQRPSTTGERNTTTEPSARAEKRVTIAVRVSRCSSPVSPRVACGVTHTSCASPPIQTAAAVTCRASMTTTSDIRGQGPPRGPGCRARPPPTRPTRSRSARAPGPRPAIPRRTSTIVRGDHRERGGDVDATAELASEPGRLQRRADRPAMVKCLPERHARDLGALHRERDPAASEHQHGGQGEQLVGAVGLAQIGHLGAAAARACSAIGANTASRNTIPPITSSSPAK